MSKPLIRKASQKPAYKALNIKKVNESLLNFWLPYLQRSLEFNITLNDDYTLKIVPFYGIIFNEYDVSGQSFFIDIDFGSAEPVTISISRSLISIILGHYLDPLLPEHFDDKFVCLMLEMILTDILNNIKEKTGISVKFMPFSGAKGNFKSQWRIYVNDDSMPHSVLAAGKEEIVKDFLDKVFSQTHKKKTLEPAVALTVFSVMRKISIQKLQNLKLGEIIILMTKRHPINQPLVLIGNAIILHTQLDGMALQLTQNPSMIHDVEELKMTVQNDDINAIAEAENPSYDDQHEQEQKPPQSELDVALNDYKVTVMFELNRLEMPAKALSQLTQGSVINLQKEITEDIFLTVSGRTIAVGEVVQVGQNFGVLIKEVFNG
ncbi:MAG: flagellar motor switch/type III secretory pathway protein FliN [Alphaproteobacteria bacterium]|jgi:flagellar motor switch/type III secretory pathway protein FliN